MKYRNLRRSRSIRCSPFGAIPLIPYRYQCARFTHRESATSRRNRNRTVDHAVTDTGVASPLGRSLAERASELIDIAHPDHRDQLRFDAHRAGPLPRIRSRTKKESWPTPLPIR
jgi:hypothetical protein